MAGLMYELKPDSRYSQHGIYPFCMCRKCASFQVEESILDDLESKGKLYISRGAYGDHCRICDSRTVQLVATSSLGTPTLILSVSELINLMQYGIHAKENFTSPMTIRDLFRKHVSNCQLNAVSSTWRPAFEYLKRMQNMFHAKGQPMDVLHTVMLFLLSDHQIDKMPSPWPVLANDLTRAEIDHRINVSSQARPTSSQAMSEMTNLIYDLCGISQPGRTPVQPPTP